jgi:hypothetical protein
MALAPRDDDPDPHYFAGRDQLALGLGYPDPTVKAAQTAVKQALQALVAAGVVERTSTAHTGVRQSYRLLIGRLPEGVTEHTPDTTDGPVDNTPTGGHSTTPRPEVEGVTERPPLGVTERPPKGVAERPDWGSLNDPTGGHSVTPLYPRNPRDPQRRPTQPLPADMTHLTPLPVDNDDDTTNDTDTPDDHHPAALGGTR